MAYKNFTLTEIIEEIGQELKKTRIQKGVTINYVANTLSESGTHISSTLLSRMENGERRIDDETLLSLCEYYQIDPKSIIIAASRMHIEKIQFDSEFDKLLYPVEMNNEELISLYKNLNHEGQKEILHLMRMMAYMEAFKK